MLRTHSLTHTLHTPHQANLLFFVEKVLSAIFASARSCPHRMCHVFSMLREAAVAKFSGMCVYSYIVHHHITTTVALTLCLSVSLSMLTTAYLYYIGVALCLMCMRQQGFE